MGSRSNPRSSGKGPEAPVPGALHGPHGRIVEIDVPGPLIEVDAPSVHRPVPGNIKDHRRLETPRSPVLEAPLDLPNDVGVVLREVSLQPLHPDVQVLPAHLLGGLRIPGFLHRLRRRRGGSRRRRRPLLDPGCPPPPPAAVPLREPAPGFPPQPPLRYTGAGSGASWAGGGETRVISIGEELRRIRGGHSGASTPGQPPRRGLPPRRYNWVLPWALPSPHALLRIDDWVRRPG